MSTKPVEPPAAAALVMGALVAMLLVWRVLAVGFNGLLGDARTGDEALAALEGKATDAVWRERFARNPTNVDALLGLALELERQNKLAEAKEAIRQALRLDSAYSEPLITSARFYLRAGDEQQALPILRRLIDLYPEYGDEVFPVFIAQLDSTAGRTFLLDIARDNPPWWPAFFERACEKATQLGELLELFTLRAKDGVVTRTERAGVIARAQREGLWAEAYQLWLGGLPQAQHPVGGLYNGGFEWPLSNVGFDWIVPARERVRVDSQPAEGAHGKRALRVSFVNTRYSGPPIYQYLMLPAGRYQLEGTSRSDRLESWLGLQWGLYCRAEAKDATQQQLARTERFVGSTQWTEFRQEFKVPTGCAVQILRLELANPRSDAEEPGNVVARLRGTLWYDDLKVVSLDGSAEHVLPSAQIRR